MIPRSDRRFLCSRSVTGSDTVGGTGASEPSTGTVGVDDGSPLSSPSGDVAGVDVSGASVAPFAKSAGGSWADWVADDPRWRRQGDESRKGRVPDEPRDEFVADGPAPVDVSGAVSEVVELEDPPDEPESVPVVDEEPVDSDDELEDDWFESSGAADAAPMPPVPTNPATPSEKATAPTRNAYFVEFIVTSRLARSVAQEQIEETVVTLPAIPLRVAGVVVCDLDLRTVCLASLKRRVVALHLNLVCVGHPHTESQQSARGQHCGSNRPHHAHALSN